MCSIVTGLHYIMLMNSNYHCSIYSVSVFFLSEHFLLFIFSESFAQLFEIHKLQKCLYLSLPDLEGFGLQRSQPLELQLVTSRGQIQNIMELYLCLCRKQVFGVFLGFFFQKLLKCKCNFLFSIIILPFAWNVLFFVK